MVLISCCCFSPSIRAASSRSAGLAYTAATALPEPHSRTQRGCVWASFSYRVRSAGCFPNTGISKSFPPSRPTLPQPVNPPASSTTGPGARGGGIQCVPPPGGVGGGGGEGRQRDGGGRGGRRVQSKQPLAAAPGDRRRHAAREERDVGAESHPVVQQLGAGDRGAHERVHGVKRGRRRAPAAPPSRPPGDPVCEVRRPTRRGARCLQRRTAPPPRTNRPRG